MTSIPEKFTGVFAAALTPMSADLAPDMALMAKHCRWLLDNGCDGLAILGTTGEANSLSLAERIGVIESLIDAGIPASVLMPGTGSCALPDAVELTRFAVEAGCGGALLLPPFYYKNPSDEGLYAFFSEVIQRLGDPRFRAYLYHFPQMSATPISHALIERLLKDYPETICGLKDSSGDLDNMLGTIRNFPGFHVFTGSDNQLLPVLEAGGAGCITASANVVSGLAAGVLAGFKSGADVSAINADLCEARRIISQFPLSAGLKQMMHRHTGEGGWLNIRPPLRVLDDGDRNRLFVEFDGIGYSVPAGA